MRINHHVTQWENRNIISQRHYLSSTPLCGERIGPGALASIRLLFGCRFGLIHVFVDEHWVAFPFNDTLVDDDLAD